MIDAHPALKASSPQASPADMWIGDDFHHAALEEKNPGNKSVLVVGPRRHGGWASMDGDALGNIRFDSKTGVYFRNSVELP